MRTFLIDCYDDLTMESALSNGLQISKCKNLWRYTYSIKKYNKMKLSPSLKKKQSTKKRQQYQWMNVKNGKKLSLISWMFIKSEIMKHTHNYLIDRVNGDIQFSRGLEVEVEGSHLELLGHSAVALWVLWEAGSNGKWSWCWNEEN